MTSNSIQIYEFSTGIYPERTADGGWVSRGFTGQYMNATIEVPYAVERSIANKEFAIAEGASSDDPAIIGRVVLGNQQPDWSVVAIVTRGRDEKGRKPSLYRYFISEGANSLWKILAWIEDYQRQNGKMPVYDPFETPERPHQWTVSAQSQLMLSPEAENLPHNPSSPILLPPGQGYTFQTVHRLAIKKSANNQPVSWAFNVEAVEEPRRFLVIQAASQKAYQILERAIANSSQIVPAVSVDEQAIKSTLKGLMNNSTVKHEYVHTLAQSIANPQISQPYWNQIFDSQGAGNAIKQGIYSPQMVRLLMLRAIAIPNTLPQYLNWLDKGKKQNDLYNLAAEFESQLKTYLVQITTVAPNIEGKIGQGFQVLLSELLNQKVVPEAANLILGSENGLWTKLSRQFIEDVDNDLSLMGKFAFNQRDLPFRLTDASWQKIWQDLRIYWKHRGVSIKKEYRPLAELFDKLEEPKIAAFFYHVSYGQVPKKIFAELESDGFISVLYGVEVRKEVTPPELLWLVIKELGGKTVPGYLVFALVFASFFLGFGLRSFFISSAPHSQQGKNQVAVSNLSKENSPNQVNSLPNNPGNNGFYEMDEKQRKTALSNFDKTVDGISDIYAQLKTNDKIKQKYQPDSDFSEFNEAMDKALRRVLNDETITYGSRFITDQQDRWIKAIYSYQNDKKLKPNGYLKKGDNTYKKLKEDLEKELVNKNDAGV